MTGLFNTLNSATSGLRAQQTALQTVSHNLANANTKGYSRQRVTMAASTPHIAAGVGHIGTGVDISGITRISDNYVNDQLRVGNSTLERYETTSDMLGQLELIYNEPSDTGLATQMTEFFNSWNYLATNPELATSKTMVVRQSETFASTLNHMGNQMDTLAEDTERQITQQVKEFNALTSQLADINKQVFEATVQGHRPNDLLDQQDWVLADLNNLVGVTTDRDEYNRALVKMGDHQLVIAEEALEIDYKDSMLHIGTTQTDASGETFVAENEVSLLAIERGSIRGLEDALTIIKGKKSDLDAFAQTFADTVNSIHTGDNASATEFFVYDDKASQSLKVNPVLVDQPEKVNAGQAVDPTDPSEIIAGDGSRAKEIADLQNKAIGGSTLFNRYNDMVTDMGIDKQQADNMAANQTDLVALLEQRRESLSGVDINEEVVNMIQYQSGFQANARVISVISEMLDTLINRTGV